MTVQPNAEQRRWRELVRKEGSVLTRLGSCEIHHPIGRTAKIKGVGNIGHWFILALTPDEHRWIDQGNAGLDRLKDNYRLWNMIPGELEDFTLHEFEKFLFKRMCRKFNLPFEADIYHAIMEYKR